MRWFDSKALRLILGLVLATAVLAGTTNFDSLALSGDLDVTGTTTVAAVTASGAVSGAGVTSTAEVTAGTFLNHGGCPDLASATTLVPTESCHVLTGSTAITGLTTGDIVDGTRLVLIWGGSITLTDGDPWVLAGGSNFAGAAGDTWEGIFNDGQFLELGRADNTP